MGACDISFNLKGKASKAEISRAFSNQVASDRSENGHADGYSGDFQTVHCVSFDHLGEVFDSHALAFDYCISKAKKWESVVAVYYKERNGEIGTLVAGWGAC